MLAAGDRAPAFDLPDLSGRRHRLIEALTAGSVLAVFWKPKCGTCAMAFPYYQRLVEAYPNAAWQILAVSQDDAETTATFAEEHGLTFPVLIEGEGWPVSQEYDPDATPTLYLIDREGVIQQVSVGFHKQELNEIARWLAEDAGDEPQIIAADDDGNPPFKPG